MDQSERIRFLENRLQQLENRLGESSPANAVGHQNKKLEEPLNKPAAPGHTPQQLPATSPQQVKARSTPVAPPSSAPNPPPGNHAAPAAIKRQQYTPANMGPIRPYAASASEDSPTVTKVLGFGGAASMILACIYLLRLAYDYGLFTPQRQVLAAFVTGGAMLLAGLFVDGKHKTLATNLCASAIVVLFLTVGAGYHIYNLIERGPATAAAALLFTLSIWLETYFRSSIFTFVAVLAAYMLPYVIPELVSGTSGSVIYFGGCAIVFSIYALITGTRRIYLSAMYLGIVLFAWHTRGNGDWRALMGYQAIQFCIFAIAAVLISMTLRKPMRDSEAWAHAPALVIFYLVQFFTLREHAPHAVAWVSAGSALFLVLLYQIATLRFRALSPGIKTIVVAYVVVALVHGVYIESVPDKLVPWVGLITGPLALFLLRKIKENSAVFGPMLFVCSVGFIYNNIRILFLSDSNVPNADLLRILYAIQLWAGFYLLRREPKMRPIQVLSLYGGHFQALAACIAVLSDRLEVSLAWGVMALICLGLGVAVKSREVGRSALVILAAAGAKAAFYDLDDSQPVLRVACLAVLGFSLFASGWLYTKLETRTGF